MVTDRVRFKPLQERITDPATVARHIQDGTNLFISGFTAGYPKLIPQELVNRAEKGERFKINLDRIPSSLPWQAGVGDVANAVLSGFIDDKNFHSIDIYSEVLQDSVLDLIDLGKVRAASGSALTLSEKARDRFFNEIYRYREKIVLRPVEISLTLIIRGQYLQCRGSGEHRSSFG
jgi:acyl-CoA hydrolase